MPVSRLVIEGRAAPTDHVLDDSDDSELQELENKVMSATAPLPWRQLAELGSCSDQQWYTRRQVAPRVPALPKWLRQQIDRAMLTDAVRPSKSLKKAVVSTPKGENTTEGSNFDQGMRPEANTFPGQRRGGEMLFVEDGDGEEGLHERRRIRWKLLVKLRGPKRKLEDKPNDDLEDLEPDTSEEVGASMSAEDKRTAEEKGLQSLQGLPLGSVFRGGRLENAEKKRQDRNQAFKEITLKSDKTARVQRLNHRRKQMYKGQDEEDSQKHACDDLATRALPTRAMALARGLAVRLLRPLRCKVPHALPASVVAAGLAYAMTVPGHKRHVTGAASQDELKKQVGYKAVDDYVKSGMVIGLGTGSTAYFAVERVGQKLQSGELKDIVAVPTSKRTQEQAEKLGIKLATLDTQPKLDVAIDGADSVDTSLNLVKGGGGAHFREKIVEVTEFFESAQKVLLASASYCYCLLISSAATFVDVRDKDAFSQSHLYGAWSLHSHVTRNLDGAASNALKSLCDLRRVVVVSANPLKDDKVKRLLELLKKTARPSQLLLMDTRCWRFFLVLWLGEDNLPQFQQRFPFCIRKGSDTFPLPPCPLELWVPPEGKQQQQPPALYLGPALQCFKIGAVVQLVDDLRATPMPLPGSIKLQRVQVAKMELETFEGTESETQQRTLDLAAKVGASSLEASERILSLRVPCFLCGPWSAVVAALALRRILVSETTEELCGFLKDRCATNQALQYGLPHVAILALNLALGSPSPGWLSTTPKAQAAQLRRRLGSEAELPLKTAPWRRPKDDS
eukprot:s180_g37.t3